MYLFNLAVLPALVILIWVIKRDRLPEPPGVVWRTFGLGVLSVFPVIVFETAFDRVLGVGDSPSTIRAAVIDSFAVAALVEESFKFLVLSRYAARHSAFDEPFDGIVYGVAASLGFAAIENVGYVFNHGAATAVLRAFTSVPVHAACGVLMGACIGIGTFARSGRRLWTFAGVIGAILLHGTYDTLAFSAEVFSDRHQSMFSGIAALGIFATALFAMAASVLGVARMRRDQERRIAAQATIPTAVVLTAPVDSAEATAEPTIASAVAEAAVAPAIAPESAVVPIPQPVLVAPVAPLPPPGAPKWPMVAVIGASMSAALCVLLVMVGVFYVGMGSGAAMSDAMALFSLLCVVLAAAGSAVSVGAALVALFRRERWRAASVSALVMSSVMLLLIVGLIALAIQTP